MAKQYIFHDTFEFLCRATWRHLYFTKWLCIYGGGFFSLFLPTLKIRQRNVETNAGASAAALSLLSPSIRGR